MFYTIKYSPFCEILFLWTSNTLSPDCIHFGLEISFIVMKLLTKYPMTSPKSGPLTRIFILSFTLTGRTIYLASFLSCFLSN